MSIRILPDPDSPRRPAHFTPRRIPSSVVHSLPCSPRGISCAMQVSICSHLLTFYHLLICLTTSRFRQIGTLLLHSYVDNTANQLALLASVNRDPLLVVYLVLSHIPQGIQYSNMGDTTFRFCALSA
ncbi:hypothetical protein BRADI_1g32912v3 [Brachypodium distachyon]|uniref:Uncharacterized protein n=1 Tax=Brachypodium distachyon TaxID=15368 RepID=A0A2K2DME9_BRADI|nr:hypothetical protein BRADI_1g32912v3 [Brachypodium distachyon]